MENVVIVIPSGETMAYARSVFTEYWIMLFCHKVRCAQAESHKSQLEGILTGQIWDNLSFKIILVDYNSIKKKWRS